MNQDNNMYSIMAFVFSAIAVLLFPVIFGPVAIVLSSVGISKKERLGNVALTVSIVATLLGMFLGVLFASLVMQ